MTPKKPNAVRGRPATVHGNYHKPRQLGRVSETDWQALQGAARASGKKFTQWAIEILLTAAKTPDDTIIICGMSFPISEIESCEIDPEYRSVTLRDGTTYSEPRA